jgi:hypothetical protein
LGREFSRIGEAEARLPYWLSLQRWAEQLNIRFSARQWAKA